MKNKIPIAFATNLKFLPYIHAPINSLLINTSKEYSLDIIILYNDDITISDQQKFLEKYQNINDNIIKFFNIKEIYEKYLNTIQVNNRLTNASLYRLLLPEIINYDKAIYLDIDLIVTGDISELYNIDLDDNYLGAAKGLGFKSYIARYKEKLTFYIKYNINLDNYFNSGVLIFNCKKFRELKLIQKLTEIAKDIIDECSFVDQDSLNFLSDKTKFLDNIWNYTNSMHHIKNDNVKIIHFNGYKKPWNSTKLQCSDLWRKYYEYKFD